MSKKKLALSLSLALMAVALTSTMALAGITLDYWFMTTDPVQIRMMEDAVAEYNAFDNGVTIELEIFPDNRERVAAALAANMGPDLMWYWHNVPWFWGVEAVVPLNDYVNDPEIGIDAGSVSPAFRETVHYGGVVMAVPVFSEIGATGYNRDMFHEAGLTDADAPTTWEELTDLAIKLTKRVGPRTTQWGMWASSVDWFLQEVMLTNGGDWVNDDLTEYAPTVDSLIEGLHWWHDLTFKHQVMPITRGVSWTGTGAVTTADEAFVLGQAAMAVGGFGMVGNTANQNPDLDIGAVPNPLGPSSGGQRTSGTGYNGIHVMKDTEYPLEAYMFAKWFFEEKAIDYAKGVRRIPTHTEALSDPELLADPMYDRVLPAVPEIRLRNFHNFPGRLDVRSEEPAMVERVLLDVQSPEESVAQFKAHAARVFTEWEDELAAFREAHVIVW